MRILGFVNMVRQVLDIVRTYWVARTYPLTGEQTLEAWLMSVASTGKTPVLVLEDVAHWPSFREQPAPCGFVLAPSLEWLERHGVPCLDVVRDNMHQRIQRLLSPEIIVGAIQTVGEHEASAWDKWVARDACVLTCAGCTKQSRCGVMPSSAKRCDEHTAVKTTNKDWFNAYGLGQLLHLSLSRCQEDLLLVSPEDIWTGTFDFLLSTDKGRRSRWIQNYGRAMLGAGVEKRWLQGIVSWVDKYSGVVIDLAKRKVFPKQAPPTKADVKFAYRRLKAQRPTKGVLA